MEADITHRVEVADLTEAATLRDDVETFIAGEGFTVVSSASVGKTALFRVVGVDTDGVTPAEDTVEATDATAAQTAFESDGKIASAYEIQ